MSDPKKKFMCSLCGMIVNDNDFERPWGKDSICPRCYDQQRRAKMNKNLVVNRS